MRHQPAETVRLRDGRALEFAAYGDPGGHPVLFFHGFIGSHHQAALADGAAREHGLALIAPNRPGVGRSSPRPRRAIVDSVGDVAQLADALGLKAFSVMGASGGAPYALACLCKLPGRVRGATIVSGLGPVGEREVLAAMNPFARRALWLGRRLPFAVRWTLASRLKFFNADPEAFLSALVRHWSRTDQELFTRPALRRMFLGDLHEVLVNGQGPAGLAAELGLYFRWGFALGEAPLGARATFWHGTADHLVPPFMAEYLARQLPGAEVCLRPGGHFMVVDYIDEICRRVREAVDGDVTAASRKALDGGAGRGL